MILVDAANVVGSRPTGWWRDRAGAARQLVERLREVTAAGVLAGPVVVVLEGVARLGVGEGMVDDVMVLHATGEGDDTLAAVAAEATEAVVLVDADRGLRRRVERRGADAVGPGWLLDRLAAPEPGPVS